MKVKYNEMGEADEKTAAVASAASAAPKNDYALAKHLISGAIGGVALVLVGQPFDTVKARMLLVNWKSNYAE